ncbi:hypothetical protein PAESOLCIP111_03973 [Paenibacillus solanacearum]|uniref:Phage tail protein n=1 Tax=Paenibacillus solanacearum TaxID=2048548 RepID=A0A916K3G6_9BACL|nr:phage tail protein [Paenibacillus solanacearum]CAG7638752.1 hypothetical protein PAESOLCIP111_03973 [Paenibacillus solanacearum]
MIEPTFFSFRRPPDWRRGTSYQAEMTPDGLSLVREPVYRQVRSHSVPPLPSQTSLADMIPGRGGRWYAIDAGGGLWRIELSSHAELLVQAPPEADRLPLVAAVRSSLIMLHPGNATSLQSISADRAQIRWTAADWRGEPFRGMALAAASDDGAMVLASVGDSIGLQLLRFLPDGSPSEMFDVTPPEWNELPDGSAGRFELTMDADQGGGWLLDKEKQRLARLHVREKSASWLPVPAEAGPVVSIAGGDSGSVWALVKPHRQGSPYSLVRLDSEGIVAERGITGTASGSRLFAGEGQLYLWDAEGLCLHAIRPVLEPAIWKPLARRLGVWISDALDSGSDATVWHKIVLDAQQDRDTQIVVRYYASDTLEAEIAHARVHLDTYIADPKVEPSAKLAELSRLFSPPLYDSQDALLMKAKGRYLWILLELVGSERHAPTVRSLEVHFPRSSYLEYLPSIYRQHEPTADFLERYLSLFQTLLDQTDRHIAGVTRTFDADSASGMPLRWLLGWLGITAEDDWTDEQLRELLHEAPSLYRLRGTKRVMEDIVKIYTGEPPIILEYEQVKPFSSHPELHAIAEQLYAADPHVFHVLVKAEHAETEVKRIRLQQLIDAFKPAFATGKLIILQPWVYTDLHSYLGMNTVLSEPTLLTLNDRSSMPHHTITIDVEQDNRMDQHTRLGIDSSLE